MHKAVAPLNSVQTRVRMKPHNILFDAIGSFLTDDGWAVGSNIALSTLT